MGKERYVIMFSSGLFILESAWGMQGCWSGWDSVLPMKGMLQVVTVMAMVTGWSRGKDTKPSSKVLFSSEHSRGRRSRLQEAGPPCGEIETKLSMSNSCTQKTTLFCSPWVCCWPSSAWSWSGCIQLKKHEVLVSSDFVITLSPPDVVLFQKSCTSQKLYRLLEGGEPGRWSCWTAWGPTSYGDGFRGATTWETWVLRGNKFRFCNHFVSTWYCLLSEILHILKTSSTGRLLCSKCVKTKTRNVKIWVRWTSYCLLNFSPSGGRMVLVTLIQLFGFYN